MREQRFHPFLSIEAGMGASTSFRWSISADGQHVVRKRASAAVRCLIGKTAPLSVEVVPDPLNILNLDVRVGSGAATVVRCYRRIGNYAARADQSFIVLPSEQPRYGGECFEAARFLRCGRFNSAVHRPVLESGGRLLMEARPRIQRLSSAPRRAALNGVRRQRLIDLSDGGMITVDRAPAQTAPAFVSQRGRSGVEIRTPTINFRAESIGTLVRTGRPFTSALFFITDAPCSVAQVPAVAVVVARGSPAVSANRSLCGCAPGGAGGASAKTVVYGAGAVLRPSTRNCPGHV